MAWVGLLPLIGLALIWTLPESPRWLVKAQKQNEAAQSLRKLRQSNDIEAELVEIQGEETALNREDLGIGEVLRSSGFRWPLITSLAVNAIQQLSGINAVNERNARRSRHSDSCTFSLEGILLLGRYFLRRWSSRGESLLGNTRYWCDQSDRHAGCSEIDRSSRSPPIDRLAIGSDHGGYDYPDRLDCGECKRCSASPCCSSSL